jgi:hypothetical protein
VGKCRVWGVRQGHVHIKARRIGDRKILFASCVWRVRWLAVAGGGAASGDKVQCILSSMQQQHRRAGRTEHPRPPCPPRAQRSHMSLRGPVFFMPALTRNLVHFLFCGFLTTRALVTTRSPPTPSSRARAVPLDAQATRARRGRCASHRLRAGVSALPNTPQFGRPAKNWSGT